MKIEKKEEKWGKMKRIKTAELIGAERKANNDQLTDQGDLLQ